MIDTTDPIPVDELRSALNDRLPQDIVILHAQEVGLDFDVMGDVTRKAYRYMIRAGRLRPIHQVRFCWHFPAPLSVEAMRAAAQYLVGSWDFRSFAARIEESQDAVRTVFRCEVMQGYDGDRDMIAIDIEADGFLHHMARIITGTLVAVGRGHWRPEHVADILKARNRTAAGHLAPACGLCLEWIRFRQDCGDASDSVNVGNCRPRCCYPDVQDTQS